MDARVKGVFRSSWPRATRLFLVRDEARRWVRCQPVIDSPVTHPRLLAPGSKKFATQPDAMYALFAQDVEYVDVIVFEACSNLQNLYDKKSRYAPSTGSTILDVRVVWLKSLYNKNLRWWKKTGSFSSEPVDDRKIPVRFLRACYILPNASYREWSLNHSPSGHEYYAPESSISSVNSDLMRSFLVQMSPLSHFYAATRVRTKRAAVVLPEG
jgi:hypothetical protein